MKPTHYYQNSQGKIVYGIVIGESCTNAVWFLPICDDGKTWMKEPVWTVGVREC
jgi:hypothetical protein